MFARSTDSLVTAANPYRPSIGLSGPLNPPSASSAAANPFLAALPTPRLLDMLPRLSTRLADCVAAWPSAHIVRPASSPIRREHAAAAPKIPQVAVMCQPRR